MVEQDGLAVSMLRPEQRTLLEAAISLHPRQPSGGPGRWSIWFDLRGQFWLLHRGLTRTSRYGTAWLPSTWKWEGGEAGDGPVRYGLTAPLPGASLLEALSLSPAATSGRPAARWTEEEEVRISLRQVAPPPRLRK
jgi:hypothetical protein